MCVLSDGRSGLCSKNGFGCNKLRAEKRVYDLWKGISPISRTIQRNRPAAVSNNIIRERVKGYYSNSFFEFCFSLKTIVMRKNEFSTRHTRAGESSSSFSCLFYNPQLWTCRVCVPYQNVFDVSFEKQKKILKGITRRMVISHSFNNKKNIYFYTNTFQKKKKKKVNIITSFMRFSNSVKYVSDLYSIFSLNRISNSTEEASIPAVHEISFETRFPYRYTRMYLVFEIHLLLVA